MKRYKTSLIFMVIILLFICTPASSEVVFIVNKNVVIENSIPIAEIRNIFLGNIAKWKNDKMIKIVILKTGETHYNFLKNYVNRSPQQYMMTLRRQVFLGKGSFPKTFKSEKELIDYVAKTENTIGYAERENVTDQVIIIEVK